MGQEAFMIICLKIDPLQEVLAALHILHLDWSQFQEFAKSSINLKEFFVVRQFLCGMLFNEGVHGNAESR